MEKPINSAQVNKRAIVGKILDLTFNDYVFLNLIESVALPAGILFFQQRLSRKYNIRALSIELNYFRLDLTSAERIQIADWPHIDLRAGQKRGNTINVNPHSTLDSLNDPAFDRGAFFKSLFQIVPGAQTNSVRSRQQRIALAGLHVLNEHVNLVASLNGQLPVLHELVLVNDTFRLIAKINHDSSFRDSNHGTAYHFAFLKSRLLLLKLIKQLTEVFAARARFLFTFACGCFARRLLTCSGCRQLAGRVITRV